MIIILQGKTFWQITHYKPLEMIKIPGPIKRLFILLSKNYF